MRRITKTVFVHSYRCPKLCWLERHKREAVNDDGSLHSAEGNEVGDLAMKYFGDYIEIPYGKPEDMAAQTAQVLHDSRGKTICEASFVVGDLFCSADILRRRKDGTYDVYEVKSSTHLKDHQLEDSAFQMYVITAAGLKVHSFNLMHINPDYVLGAELDLNALFVVTDITYDVNRLQTSIEGRINECRQLLASDEEPMCSLSKKCDKPFTCPCRDYCFKLNEVPEDSVFTVSGLRVDKKYELFSRGIVSAEDLSKCGSLNASQMCQVQGVLSPEIHVDKKSIRDFLGQMRYPLYLLDFETVQFAVPRFIGTKQYQQIPFQYSLHILDKSGNLQHREFLAEAGTDPRYALAAQLVNDIPMDVMSMAYNSKFEKMVMRELAEEFPVFRNHLLNIVEGMVDLMIPFQKRYYYNPCQKGSYSIKAVLPAMCPNDPELDYHKLPVVHNGAEAMTIFAVLSKIEDAEEVERIRQGLLLYCGLDTLAMVKVLEQLYELVKEA